jgi:hypothetical protein
MTNTSTYHASSLQNSFFFFPLLRSSPFHRLHFAGVRLSLLGTGVTTDLLYQPQMIDDDDCGAVSGMKIDRGNRNTRRKPAPMPLCSPQIPHEQNRFRTRAAAMERQRLTARAMARP